VSIKYPGKRPEYFAWGHSTENNCTKRQAATQLRAAWKHPGGVCFHNAAFDMAVAFKSFGLQPLSCPDFHDTMILAFLADPYRKAMGLKALADDLFDMPPDEQNELKEWIIANVPEMRGKKKDWARYICRAPGKLVGRYANGDTSRTWMLFDEFKWVRDAMPEAYERERRLLPVLEEMSTAGIPISPEVHKLAEAMPAQRAKLDTWVRKRLGVSTDFDLQKREALCDAIEDAGLLDEWILTAKGARSLAHADFATVCNDAKFAEALHQRSLLKTLDTTFIANWSSMIQETGRLHVQWNSIRGAEGARIFGARTGRLSSTPNVQNISKGGPPVSVVRNLLIPNLRTLIKAARGKRLGIADYSQQEPRMAAHFENKELAQAYRANPQLDFHSNTMRMMAEIGRIVSRDTSKTLGLAILYALGLDALAFKLGCTREEASTLRRLFKKAVPGIAKLEQDMKFAWSCDDQITTWGGRDVWCEPPLHGRSFAYRALNYACQGSSADQTKQAMIDFHEDPKRESNLIFSVHDELGIEAPTKIVKREAKRLVTHMEGVGPFNVPFRADVGTGISWWEAKP
jgi:DNA polymerase-1